jgi:hypothetical protein
MRAVKGGRRWEREFPFRPSLCAKTNFGRGRDSIKGDHDVGEKKSGEVYGSHTVNASAMDLA